AGKGAWRPCNRLGGKGYVKFDLVENKRRNKYKAACNAKKNSNSIKKSYLINESNHKAARIILVVLGQHSILVKIK
ncbi:MAG TPA: hypothetical protein VI935_10475, partial [Thermodesulfobacteriota bacterium]|nr:hypothetical protein [Thermodesulfobacteriota bacterium]